MDKKYKGDCHTRQRRAFYRLLFLKKAIDSGHVCQVHGGQQAVAATRVYGCVAARALELCVVGGVHPGAVRHHVTFPETKTAQEGSMIIYTLLNIFLHR